MKPVKKVLGITALVILGLILILLIAIGFFRVSSKRNITYAVIHNRNGMYQAEFNFERFISDFPDNIIIETVNYAEDLRDDIQYFNSFTPSVLNAENSAKIDEMCKDIRINNSRFALPMNVSDLPQGFSLELKDVQDFYDTSDFVTNVGYDICVQSVALCYGEEYAGGAYVLTKDGETFQDGVIVGLFTIPYYAKCSIGGISGITDMEKIQAALGEVEFTSNGYCYLSKNNGFISFYDGKYFGFNGFMAFHL